MLPTLFLLSANLVRHARFMIIDLKYNCVRNRERYTMLEEQKQLRLPYAWRLKIWRC
jgi:hypothetical protein